MIIGSVHEGETLLVLFRLLSCQLFLQSDLVLLFVVVLEGWFDEDSAGHHSSNTLPQGVDLEIVDSSV